MGGWRHAAWGGNERVTVVTEVKVSNCEAARIGRTGRGHGSRENIGSHGRGTVGGRKDEWMRESVRRMERKWGEKGRKGEREVDKGKGKKR